MSLKSHLITFMEIYLSTFIMLSEILRMTLSIYWFCRAFVTWSVHFSPSKSVCFSRCQASAEWPSTHRVWTARRQAQWSLTVQCLSNLWSSPTELIGSWLLAVQMIEWICISISISIGCLCRYFSVPFVNSKSSPPCSKPKIMWI